MKVQILNLGLIKCAEIDLKPLTIFVGPNNTGKTWVAYVLGAILGRYGWERYTEAYVSGEVSETYPPLDNAIQQLLEEGNAQVDLVQFADEYGERCINSVARLAPRWMHEFMGTERVSFSDLEVRVWLEERKEHFLERVKAHGVSGGIGVSPQTGRALLTGVKKPREPLLYFFTAEEGDIEALEKLPLQAIRRFVVQGHFYALRRALYPDASIFPTERTTFIGLPWTEGEAEENAIPTREKPQRRVRVLAQPLVQFLSMIASALQRRRSVRDKEAKNDPTILKYMQLAELLEKTLGGGIEFSSEEPVPRREVLFKPAEDTTLDMPIVSSMVKELAPLVLYLRYLVELGDWLIIDEPEMNLHPKAQVCITEFLAMLVQAGLHVLVTTHSPYIVDHVMNLMKAAEHEDLEKIKDKFYLRQTKALIPMEQVSVYFFGDGTAKSILDQEGLIDWETFSSVSERIAQIYHELL